MVPFEPDPRPDLTGTSVFIGAGRADAIAPAAQAERLAELLRQAGASVTLHWEPGGHAVTEGEMEAASNGSPALHRATRRQPGPDGKASRGFIGTGAGGLYQRMQLRGYASSGSRSASR
jgi:hypothetical protein